MTGNDDDSIKLPWALVLLVTAIGFAIVAAVLVRYVCFYNPFAEINPDFDLRKQPWEECPVNLPDGLGRIVFLRKGIHPFLAEYDRKIRVELNLSEKSQAPLPVNVGGGTKINVYWYKASRGRGPYLRLHDHWGEYVVAIDEGATYEIFHSKDATCVAKLVLGEEIDGKFRTMDEHGISIVGSLQWEKSDAIYVREPGEYLGRIDETGIPLRFITPKELPEEKFERRVH